MPLNNLQSALGYEFKDISLLEMALTHSSCDKKTPDGRKMNNERLEFLGDRVLNFTVAQMLFEMFPNEPEGKLSKRHAALVRQETLAVIAQDIGIAEAIKLGKGENATGGREKPTILSDAMEAVLAAVYLDDCFSTAEALIRKHWSPVVSQVELKDAKTRLQELLQAQGAGLPEYKLKETLGEAHARTFVFAVKAASGEVGYGEGSSKQTAQQAAAQDLLEKLNASDAGKSL